MSRKNVIEVLKMENDLILFNPLTGEEISPGELSELNKLCYDAHLEAIQMLNNSIPIEWIKDTIKLAERVKPNEYARYLRMLLKDWRIENDTENN